MIKIYGMPSCPDCEYVHHQIENRSDEFESIDIGEHVKNLKEFMHLRDNNPVSEEVGLKSKPADGEACKLDGSGC